MKKITLVVAAVLAMFSANVSAQNVEKAKAGSFGTEVQFSPFQKDGNTFSLDALKFRYFITDNDALRLNVGFGFGSTKTKDDDSEDDYTKGKTGDFNIDLGYERHFDVAKRLDLYAGAQIGIFKHFASAKAEETNDLGGGQVQTIEYEYSNYIPAAGGGVQDRAHFGVAASVFTGLDFYIYKGLYIGTELGLYIESYKTQEGECKITDQPTTKMKDLERHTNVKFDIEPTIRLGWTF